MGCKNQTVKFNKICQLNENPVLVMDVLDDWLGPPFTSSILSQASKCSYLSYLL